LVIIFTILFFIFLTALIQYKLETNDNLTPNCTLTQFKQPIQYNLIENINYLNNNPYINYSLPSTYIVDQCKSITTRYFEFELVASAGFASEINNMMLFYHALSTIDVQFYIDSSSWNYGKTKKQKMKTSHISSVGSADESSGIN
jgi:hypothetical protein